jgi:CheY-like chemotaxis protein/nitrogen-specific signal transduction histidine kinase
MMEEALESAPLAQLRMKDELLSRVSHELRSPLTAVYQFVTILLDGLAGELNDEQREYLGIVLKNVKQLQVMIGDLLDVSRAQSGKLALNPREMSLSDGIGAAVDTVRPTAQAKNLSLSIQVAENLPAAYADPQRVQQVIVNLVDNAVKFTPEGGWIRVCAKVRKPLPEGHDPLAEKASADGRPVRITGEASWLEVSVADSGCGIGEEDHARIFQQLYQVGQNRDQNRMGLGLGLFICHDLVTRQGGRIWVESRVGEGSTFCFTVPAYSPEHAVLSLIQDRLVRAKATGEAFSVVVVDAAADAATLRPVWDALLAAAGEKSLAAAYAGTRFVALSAEGGLQAEGVRNRLRRLTKDVCFPVAEELCLAFSYGVAVARADAESANELLARASAAAVSESALMAQKRLIVVDDDEQGRRLLQRVMSTLGVHSVRMAASGPELFAALREELPDLIVLDIQMPGMNGHEVIGRLKENAGTAAIPIVVVSGYAGEYSGLVCATPGTAIPVLGKLDMKELRRWVSYLL